MMAFDNSRAANHFVMVYLFLVINCMRFKEISELDVVMCIVIQYTQVSITCCLFIIVKIEFFAVQWNLVDKILFKKYSKS